MSYIVYTVISALFLAVYDLFKKISVKGKKDIYEILFFYTFVSFLCGLLFINKAFNMSLINILYKFIKSCIIGLSWFFTMKAMSKLQLGIVVPFSLLGSVSTTILAFVFFDEKIEFSQIGGIIVVLMGLLFLSKLCKKSEECKNDYKYLGLLVLAAFLTSISVMIDRYLLNTIDKGSILFWFFLFLSLIYLVVCLIRNKKVDVRNLKGNLWVIGIGVSIFLSDLFYYLAISNESGSLSMVSIVRKLSVFIGVVLGGIFLKEENLLKKIVILVLMFIGLTFIMFV